MKVKLLLTIVALVALLVAVMGVSSVASLGVPWSSMNPAGVAVTSTEPVAAEPMSYLICDRSRSNRSLVDPPLFGWVSVTVNTFWMPAAAQAPVLLSAVV